MWKVPKIWFGGECWIIGGGPSVVKEFNIPSDIVAKVRTNQLPPSCFSPYMQAIQGKHVIGINSAFLLGNWVDICLFGDRGWFLSNRKELANYTGIKVSCSPHLKEDYKRENIKYLQRDRVRNKGISRTDGCVSWNNNSGAAAISLAAHLGVNRIILLGFDMSIDDDKKQHWHNLYRSEEKEQQRKPESYPFDRHMLGMDLIAKHAKQMKIEIINASPQSKITQFRKVPVKDLI